jgi:hypothetical protein
MLQPSDQHPHQQPHHPHQKNISQVGSMRQEEISQSLPIPEYKIGWIIGKRGSYVLQLCEKSGAEITISDSTSKEYGTVWKYVQITGTGRAVDKAKKLLHIRLARIVPRTYAEDGVIDDLGGQSNGSGQPPNGV